MKSSINASLSGLKSPILWSAMAITLVGAMALSHAFAAPPKGGTKSRSAPIVQATQLSDAFATVAEAVSPSVVTLRVEARRTPGRGHQARPFPSFGAPGGQPQISKGAGSGVIVRSDGAILTNNHVVKDAERIEVILQDGRHFRGELVGSDPATDLAVVKINAKGLPSARFADSGRARVGDWVVAIGSPFGLDYTLTAGVLSAKGRGGLGANEIEDYLQTDASINPGNSGGPLVDLHGRVLGINTMIIGRNTGIGFAIPSNLARHVSDQILDEGKVRRAWIGVGFQELTPELANSFGTKVRRGALVSGLAPNGPSRKAGLQPGDVIEQVDGVDIREGRDLLRSVLTKKVGQKIKLQVLRQGQRKTISVVTAERPGDLRASKGSTQPRGNSGRANKFGLNLRALDTSTAQRMDYTGRGRVVIASVQQGSPAARAGLHGGDVILEADRKRVKTPKDVVDALSDGHAILHVETNGGSRFAVITKD